MIDLGVHVIDLVRYIAGNPKPVSVYGATFVKLGHRSNLKDKKQFFLGDLVDERESKICDVEDLATAMIRFDNGMVLSVETSYSLNTENDSGRVENKLESTALKHALLIVTFLRRFVSPYISDT